MDAISAGGPDVFAYLGRRSEYGDTGDIGYFDQVRIYYKGSRSVTEYQWRDRFDERLDRPHVRVHGLGPVTVDESGGTATVSVVLLNAYYGNRILEKKFEMVDQVVQGEFF